MLTSQIDSLSSLAVKEVSLSLFQPHKTYWPKKEDPQKHSLSRHSLCA